MKKSIHLIKLAAALAAGFSVNATAHTPGCADVVWSAELLESTPTIANHCLELIERGGEWFAKIQVKIVRHGANSTVVRYREPDGSWGDPERVYPQRGFKAEIGDEEVSISKTVEGQELNVYASSQGGENFTIPMLAGTELVPVPAEDVVEE